MECDPLIAYKGPDKFFHCPPGMSYSISFRFHDNVSSLRMFVFGERERRENGIVTICCVVRLEGGDLEAVRSGPLPGLK